jgi:hypothetical protein
MSENAICPADIVKLFVYITRYVECLLAISESNWFIYNDGGELIDWFRGK